MDGTIALILGVFMIAVIVLGPIFGAEDRRAFRRPDRKPRPMVGPFEKWGQPD